MIYLSLSTLAAVEQLELGFTAAETIGSSADRLVVGEHVATLVAEHDDIITRVNGRDLLLLDFEGGFQLIE